MQNLTRKTSRVVGTLVLALVIFMNFLSVLAADQKAEQEVRQGPQYAFIADQSIYFYDVTKAYQWAYHEIDYLATLDIVRGTGDYLFEPEETISRGDFVLMLCRAYDMSKHAAGENFKDVPQSAYYYEAVLAAKRLGIVSGENGLFLPEQKISREDAMVLLLRTAELSGLKPNVDDLTGFTDYHKVSDYARMPVSKLVGAGVVGGDSKNRLNPGAQVTRAEMSVMLYRSMMMENAVDGAFYIAHPERVNLCIGDKIYPSTIVADYNKDKTYSGIMELLDFSTADGKRIVRLGAQQSINKQIAFANGRLMVDGAEMLLAEGAVAIQIAPYSVLNEFPSTDEEYQYGLPDVNANGVVTAIYYTKAE